MKEGSRGRASCLASGELEAAAGSEKRRGRSEEGPVGRPTGAKAEEPTVAGSCPPAQRGRGTTEEPGNTEEKLRRWGRCCPLSSDSASQMGIASAAASVQSAQTLMCFLYFSERPAERKTNTSAAAPLRLLVGLGLNRDLSLRPESLLQSHNAVSPALHCCFSSDKGVI